MDKIKNVRVGKKEFTGIEKYVKLLKPYKVDLYDYLPKGTAYEVDFDLTASNAEISNLIWGGFMDECPTWRFQLVYESLDSTDPAILFDDLQLKLNSTPINQTYFNKHSDPKKFKATVKFSNPTTDMKTLMTGDIDMGDEKTGRICENIPLMELSPGTSIAFNIVVERGRGFDNATFCPIGNRRLKMDDTDDVKEPTSFTIGYTTQRNFDTPFEVMHILLGGLIERITEMEAIYNTTGEQVQVILTESSHIARAVARQIYEDNPSIPYVAASYDHPSRIKSFIKIQHPEAAELFRSARKKLIARLVAIDKQFD
jgi:hypothetical protein